ncbi:MAG: MFS transporter [Nitrospinota bacterium]|nr:MFS transporter [Nitrospinota bacterium]
MSGSHSVNSVYSRVLTPILPVVLIDFDLSYFQIGMIVSTYAFASGIFQFPISFFADYLSRHRLILCLSLFISALPLIFYGHLESYSILLLLVFISGFGSSAFHPSAVALLARGTSEKLSLHMSIFKAGGDFGSIFTPVLVGWLTVYFGDWKSAVQLFSIPGFLFTVIIWLNFSDLSKEKKKLKSEVKRTFIDLFHNKVLILILLLSCCRVMGLRGIMTFLPIWIAESLGFDVSSIGWVLTMYFLVGTLSALMWGKIAEGNRETFYILLMMGIASVSLLLLTWNVSIFLTFLLIIILGGSLNPSQGLILSIATKVVEEKNRASSIGLLYSGNEVSSVLSPLIAGLVAEAYGVQKTFFFFSFLCFIAFLISISIHRLREIRQGT